MSIVKMINGGNCSRKSFRDLHEYVTAASKTKNGQTIGSSGCITSNHVIEEMLTVKKLYHKSGGRQWIHVAISLTPDEKHRPDDLYMAVGEKIANLFYGFQCFYAVHHDTKLRHLHIVLNSVSMLDGTKYSQSKSDLQRIKQKCNDIFREFGFDTIDPQAGELLDTTDYSNAVGFEYLELNEQPENRLSLADSLTMSNQITPDPDFHVDDIFAGCDLNFNMFKMDGGYPMYNNYQNASCPQAVSEPAISNGANEMTAMQKVECAVPAVSAGTSSEFPTVTLKTGAHIRLDLNGGSVSEETAAFIRESVQITEQNQMFAANLGTAIYGNLHAKGMPTNVCMDLSPTIDIFQNHNWISDVPETVIDVNGTFK